MIATNVTNTNDSGAGSLRQAIIDVNRFGVPAVLSVRVKFQPLTERLAICFDTGEIQIWQYSPCA